MGLEGEEFSLLGICLAQLSGEALAWNCLKRRKWTGLSPGEPINAPAQILCGSILPFWRLLSLPGFGKDELLPSDSLLSFLCQSVTQEPSLRVVLSHLPVIRYWQFPPSLPAFPLLPSWGPAVCSLSTALWWLSPGHCCLHLQPLLCYPIALSSLSGLHGMAWGWMVGFPAFLPSHSSMHLTLQSNCFTCLDSQALALIDFACDWIAPLPLCLLKSQPIRSRLSQMPPHSGKSSLKTSQGKMYFAHFFWASVGWYSLFDRLFGSCLLCRKRGSFIFYSSQW